MSLYYNEIWINTYFSVQLQSQLKQINPPQLLARMAEEDNGRARKRRKMITNVVQDSILTARPEFTLRLTEKHTIALALANPVTGTTRLYYLQLIPCILSILHLFLFV